MGTFTASVEIGDPGARRWEAVDVLVDSGATFTMLPRSLLEHWGVRPRDKVPFELADGRSIEYDVGETAVRIGNRVRTTLVVFGTWALGVMTPPFELPDRQDWTHEDAARAARLEERLGAKSNS